MRFLITLLAIGLFIGLMQRAKADDYFWYAYPSPYAYLYVEDPIKYRIWEARYGERSVTVPGADVEFPFSETVYFGFNSCELGAQYIKTIENAAELIAENEAIAVLGGHTDERGEADVNTRYGFCRVAAVVDVLEAFGIRLAQLEQKSFGSDQLAIEGAETEAEHALNRRVTIDFTIITPGQDVTTTESVRVAGKWGRRDYLGIWR